MLIFGPGGQEFKIFVSTLPTPNTFSGLGCGWNLRFPSKFLNEVQFVDEGGFILLSEVSFRMVAWGTVQGVGYREFVVQKALRLGLRGYVRNLPSQNAVEIIAEGPRIKLLRLGVFLWEGPPPATVVDLQEEWSTSCVGFQTFNRAD